MSATSCSSTTSRQPPNLTGPKFLNLAGAEYADYMDKREFRAALKAGYFENTKIRAILHQGACSNTLEDDGRYMMDNNFTYSKELLHFALDRKIPLVYASTAAVYGASTDFTELPKRTPTERLRVTPNSSSTTTFAASSRT